MNTVLKLKPIYKPTLEEEIERYRDLDREIKKLSKMADELKKSITNALGDKTEAFDSMGRVIATYTLQSRNSFDKEKFSVDYPGVYENYLLTTSSKTFRLK